MGPVALQAEFNYLTVTQKYEFPSTTDDKDLQVSAAGLMQRLISGCSMRAAALLMCRVMIPGN